MISAKIIADSVSPEGKRITTFSLEYWRAIHSELMTHRLFSRNASSSRAIPVQKMIDRVVNDTAMPIHWGKNQKGMQADEELLPEEIETAKGIWKDAMRAAVLHTHQLLALGVHKQIANRLLEPFGHIAVVLTATELGNWYNVRYHRDAMPDIRELARLMFEAQEASQPVLLDYDQWHLPYVEQEEMATLDLETQKKISASRCARVSYLNHEGKKPTLKEDLDLFDRLMAAFVKHPSPTEHQAKPVFTFPELDLTGNFQGWVQFRKTIPGEYLPDFQGPVP